MVQQEKMEEGGSIRLRSYTGQKKKLELNLQFSEALRLTSTMFVELS